MIKRFAIVENQRVVNVVDSEIRFFPNWIESNTANIGDWYINGKFYPNNPESQP